MKVFVSIKARGGDTRFDPLCPSTPVVAKPSSFHSEYLDIEKEVDVSDLEAAYQLAVEIIKKLERKR